jgi:hypothetical protein
LRKKFSPLTIIKAGTITAEGREGMMKKGDKLIDWAIEIQAIGQTGLAYSKDIFDTERYSRLREIAAEMLA